MAFNSDQSSMADDVIGVLGDGRTVTITRVTRGTFAGTTGKTGDTTSTATVTAVVGAVTTDTFAGRPKRTRWFKFRTADLAWTPDANDRVTFDGVTWQVKQGGVTFSAGGALVRVECGEVLAGSP